MFNLRTFYNERVTRNGDVSFNTVSHKDTAVGLATIKNERIILRGLVRMHVMRGNPKFGDEMQFSILAPKGSAVIERRDTISAEKWETIEICIPLQQGIELLKAFNTMLITKKITGGIADV